MMSDQTENSPYEYQQIQEIPVSKPPQRIVSLVPSMTESLFDLNLGSRLVGRTDYCIYPEGLVDAIPSISGTKSIDVERVIALNPDLVIANKEENSKHNVEKLQDAGLAVWVTMPQTIQDVFNLLWNVMYVSEETTMSARVRIIEATYDYLHHISEEKEETNPVKAFVPIWHEPLMTFNQHTYAHDVLRVLGGINVFAKRERRYPLAADLSLDVEADVLAPDDIRDTRYPRISIEEVVAMQPDVILLPDEPFKFNEAHIEIFHKLDIPAAKHNRIHLIDGSLLTWHGTRVAYAMDRLTELFRIGDNGG